MFDDLFGHEAFALIRMRGADTVTLLAGPRTDLETLAQIPLQGGSGSGWESLVLVPFAPVPERGFVAHQDGTVRSRSPTSWQRCRTSRSSSPNPAASRPPTRTMRTWSAP